MTVVSVNTSCAGANKQDNALNACKEIFLKGQQKTQPLNVTALKKLSSQSKGLCGGCSSGLIRPSATFSKEEGKRNTI
jgi:hypothetical protein